MASSVVGTAVYKIEVDSSEIKGALAKVKNDFSTGGKAAATSFLDKVRNTFSTTVLANAFSTVSSAMSNAISAGVKRLDTIKNANKVFEALGYSADVVSTSMDTLKSYLDGLPTSMTDAVSGVQMLSSSFEGLENGTKYYIAMNDAGLAFGATSEQIKNAIIQLSQTSLDGPLDAQTWNSLRNSGFSPVFAAMAKEAGVTVGELKKDFGGLGTKTVQDFLDALVRLDTEGSGSMESLASLARKNTNGIGTAWENVQNRMAKAVETILGAFGQGEISNVINDLSHGIVDLGERIAGVIRFFKENEAAATALKVALGALAALVGTAYLASFAKFLRRGLNPVGSGLKTVSSVGVKLVKFITSSALPAIGKVAVALATNPTTWIVAGIAAVVAGIVLLVTHLKEVGEFFGFIGEKVGEFFTPIGEAIGAATNAVGDFIGKVGEWISGAANAVGEFFAKIAGAVGEFFSWAGEQLSQFFVSVLEVLSNFLAPFGDFLWNCFILVVAIFTNLLQFIWEGVLVPIGGFFATIFGTIFETVSGVFAAIGDFIGVVIGGIVESVGAAIGAVGEAIGTAVEFTKETIGTITSWLGANVIEPVGQFFVGLWNGIVEGVKKFVDRATKTIGAIVGWIDKNVIQPVGRFFEGLWDGMTKAVGDFVSGFTRTIGQISSWVDQNVIQPIGQFFSGLWEGIKQGAQALAEGLGNIFSTIGGIIKAPINGIIGGINGIIDAINSITVPDWVPVLGGQSAHFPHIGYLASGGIVPATAGGRLIVAGEGGEDEWVVPESKMASLIDKLEERGSGGGGDTYNIYVNGVFATSAQERRRVADQIVEAINQNNRRRFA